MNAVTYKTMLINKFRDIRRIGAGLMILLVGFAGDVVLAQQDPISAEDVNVGAALAGLEFSESEIQMLTPALEDFRKAYAALRSVGIANDVSPALFFNPIPQNYVNLREQEPVVFSSPGEVSLPECRDDLAYFSVLELAKLIETRQITSVELTQFFLDRLKRFDPQLHCVISLTEELAMEQAKRADCEIAAGKYRGPLHGIPYGAKDLLATKKYKTTWGAAPYKDQRFDYDATVIKNLEEAGSVLVAKLSLGALAWGDVWFEEMTRNPWDTSKGSSGSSAGSASAVSAGLVPFAIGTETLGSIVSPSTVCGVTGLRPTFGRVSRHGAMALCWSMDKIGPICRSAEDCALIFQAILGQDGKDLTVSDYPFNYRDGTIDPQKIRIGYDRTSFESEYPFKKQDESSLQVFRELGYELIPIELPKMPEIGFILSVEAAAAFDELTLSGRDDLMVRQISNAWPNVFRQARFVPAVEYIQANRARSLLIQEMARVFEKVDIYIHPSWAGASLRITNYTGHPSIVIPNGFQENGLPTSISMTSRLFEEGLLVGLAKLFQDRTQFDDIHPQLAP